MKSARVRSEGIPPVLYCTWDPNVPSPTPRSTLIVSLAELTTARSRCASELKRPDTTVRELPPMV